MAGAFLHYPNSAAISLLNQSNVVISGKSFRNLGAVAIILDTCTNVYLHDLDFDSCKGCILMYHCTGNLRVEDIRARNTGDGTIGSGHSNVVQFLGSFTGGGTNGIRRVRSLGGNTEDMISVYQSGGLDVANPLVIEDCKLESPTTGPLAYTSGSGTGIMCADSTGAGVSTCEFVLCQNNTILNAGQVGIANWSGKHIRIENNIIYGSDARLRANAGIYTPFGGAGGYTNTPYVGNNVVTGNRIRWKTDLNGNRVFSGGTYYTNSGTLTDIYDGEIAGALTTPAAVNTLDDGTINPATLAVVLDDGPTISSDSPAVGGIAGGTTVVLAGVGFTGATSVKFGGVNATSFTVNSDTQITCVAPAHAAGTVQIVVA